MYFSDDLRRRILGRSHSSRRYWDEILRTIVRPNDDAVGPGYFLVARVYRKFLEEESIDAIDWPSFPKADLICGPCFPS